MPLGPGVRYRVKQTPKGPVRLAFRGKGTVVESKNLKTGAVHSPAEFATDRARRQARKPAGQWRRKKSVRQIEAELKKGRNYRV